MLARAGNPDTKARPNGRADVAAEWYRIQLKEKVCHAPVSTEDAAAIGNLAQPPIAS